MTQQTISKVEGATKFRYPITMGTAMGPVRLTMECELWRNGGDHSVMIRFTHPIGGLVSECELFIGDDRRTMKGELWENCDLQGDAVNHVVDLIQLSVQMWAESGVL